MKKNISLMFAAVILAAVFSFSAFAETDVRLEALQGSFIELFPEFAKEEFHDHWIECIRQHTDDPEMAEMYYQMLLRSCMGELRGQEAIDHYSEHPDEILFDCFFSDGVSSFRIDGNVISGFDAEGKEVFSHAYTFLRDEPIVIGGETMEGMFFHVYQPDAEGDPFTYFAFADDTPAETFHLEFRYGPTLEHIGDYFEGSYAYWLAAAISADYAESTMMQDCIKLFVDENMAELSAEAAAVTEIATAEELAAVRENLSGNYVLTADIDLSGIDWEPIGSFAPAGESEEEQEIPSAEMAFTGTFSGNGHKISNLTVNKPEGFAVGLFGCVSNSAISGFTVENASADGMAMTSDVVGYAYNSLISDVHLVNGKVTAHSGEISAEGMYGGIVGAGMGSVIMNCSASADIVIGDNTANAGIIGGGLEMTSVIGCSATGTVTAGDDCYGLGGISGCGFASEEFTNNTAENVLITAGKNAYWIGGITGYAGGFGDEFGMPVTKVSGCTARNVVVTAEGAEGVDGIVGSGFYNERAAEMMGKPFDQPTVFEITDCVVE